MTGLDIGFILLTVIIVGYGIGTLTWFLRKHARGDFERCKRRDYSDLDQFH